MEKNKSKNKFTLRIILSYLILGGLALIAGIFILAEVKSYLVTDTSSKNDTKLIRTGSLLTQLYEAESLSKLALQTKTKENFTAYAQKIDSVSVEIDSLKQVIFNPYQTKLLDSVQYLLKQKTYNNEELRRLKLKNDANSSLDAALNKFLKMEASFEKISIYDFNPTPQKLPEYERKVLEDWVALLNANVPSNNKTNPNTKNIDSILQVSKKILTEAKNKDALTQRSLAEKEMEINKNDLDLSQQLRRIISAFEQEVINATYNDNQKREDILNRSTRLAGIAALLGFIVVGIFTFLITRDYWRVQTYRQNLEEEKKYSESLLKSREQLISTVSHDLRTPLNTITGYSELMENTGLTGKQVGYLRNVKSAAKYVDSLVNDLLDFSKLEAGKLKIENIPFILSDLIEETSSNLQEINKKKNIELIIQIDDKLDQAVIGDPFRIRQVLTNLISNAYKFTHEGSIKVIASVEIDQHKKYQTKIAVIDSGIGIEKEKQQHIFKEFTQADDSTEKKYGGYGLGLTISKKLAELLNGSLKLKSEKDKGSTFTLQIPLAVSENKTIIKKKKLVSFIKPGLSILLIDDDTAMLRLLKEVCETLHIEAISFSDFNEIDKTKNLKYDVVLTDIQMPTIDGFEVLKHLKSGNYKHYKNQPILAMTGRKDLSQETYYKAGFTSTLQKPFSKDIFLDELSTLFPEKALNVENKSKIVTKNIISSLYSLDTISSFLGDNDDGVKDVINTFLIDTETNVTQLKNATRTKDLKTINSVTHRMLPMFRQLQANEIIPTLEQFETLKEDELTDKEIKTKFRKVENSIIALKLALNTNQIINPDYNG
ncbi:response regulator [Cellulophaga sp. HaHaR_3_176]|uniref:hybrid sensor histidine kinase/response regulator n=1 Tax=Cellulophaga sp. HaHaR_3_176 TaxID=1942464 RepID=UPI001C1F7FA3|nr:ATP-binding protein [Cellulophaga sp. HaHaR_3_176]QWX83273.1 response regulator [Cellulophaga sp. HaHaR_3_176]